MKREVDISIVSTGVVFTNTVAFSIVVSLTDEMKKMKWDPKRTPNKKILPSSVLNGPNLIRCRRIKTPVKRTSDAIPRRPNATENTLRPGKSLMNIEAVPKKNPASPPCSNATLLFP